MTLLLILSKRLNVSEKGLVNLSFLERIKKQVLVADGAMGSMLYSHGVDRSFEELNLTEPDQIRSIHETYIAAGADVIQTNSYGANYVKLARYGLEEQVKKINTASVRLAKEASKNRAFVLGNIGGIHGAHKQLASEEEVKRSFREQLYCLLLEGVDGILLETYYNFEELTSVVKIAREETDLPIIANVTLHEPGILENGLFIADAFTELRNLGANVTGINCQMGPSQIVTSLESVPINEDTFLAAYPNASLPSYNDGILTYENAPEYFEASAKELRDQGVRLIGGCCGTTPEHIRSIAKGVSGLAPVTEKEVIEIPRYEIKESKKSGKETLAEKAKKKRTLIVELGAPKHLDISEYLKGAKALKEAGIDALTLADNSLASPRIDNLAMATIVKERLGIEPLVHLTCRDRNLIGMQSHLLGLHTLGITELLAITGDPTKIGDFPGASSVFDVNSFKLLELIQKGNTGLSFAGQSLREKTNFNVACALDPNVLHLDKAVRRLEKKIKHGANFVMTQPIYSKEKIIELKEATKHLDIPIFVGIMPITSTKNAEFLHNEVPGITLTNDVRARMKEAGSDRKKAEKVSLAMSRELVETAAEHFNGIYLITPFMRYGMIIKLLEDIKKYDLLTNKEEILT